MICYSAFKIFNSYGNETNFFNRPFEQVFELDESKDTLNNDLFFMYQNLDLVPTDDFFNDNQTIILEYLNKYFLLGYSNNFYKYDNKQMLYILKDMKYNPFDVIVSFLLCNNHIFFSYPRSEVYDELFYKWFRYHKEKQIYYFVIPKKYKFLLKLKKNIKYDILDNISINTYDMDFLNNENNFLQCGICLENFISLSSNFKCSNVGDHNICLSCLNELINSKKKSVCVSESKHCIVILYDCVICKQFKMINITKNLNDPVFLNYIILNKFNLYNKFYNDYTIKIKDSINKNINNIIYTFQFFSVDVIKSIINNNL